MYQTKSKPSTLADRKSIVAIIGVVAVLLAGLAYWAWTETPQLKADSDVYASLDALFTAVTARRESLVTNCESKLLMLHREGKIPKQAWKRISHIIETTKADQWESAAEDLYSFIEDQNGRT